MTESKNSSAAEKDSDWQYQALIELARTADISPAKLAPIQEILWPVYYDYDAKAAKWQRRFRTGAVAVYGLSGLAVAVAIMQLLFMPAAYKVAAFEVAAMVLALVLLTVSHRWHWKWQWLTTRYTAEQLRMRMYLALVPLPINAPPHQGLTGDPSKTLPFYSQLGATLPADAETAMRDSRFAGCVVGDLAALRTWVGGWIASQVEFHRGAARRHRRASRIARWTTIGLFAITLVAATLHAFGLGHRLLPDGHLEGSPVAHLIVFLSIALPAIASAVHAINDLLDHERVAVRSEGMTELLERLATELAAAQTLEQIRDVARRTEQVMAVESFEWVTALTFRQPPHAPA